MKRRLILLLSLIMTLCFCGCGLIPSVELTESEQKVIAEYAAGLLLKHDKNYSGDLTAIEEEKDLEIIQEDKMPQQDEIPVAEENPEYVDPEFSEDLMADGQGEVDSVEYSEIPIAQAIGLDGFDIIYKSKECKKIYPDSDSSDLVFSLEAAPGMDLLILTFGVTNNTGDKLKCDILDSGAGFRLLINGSEKVQAQKTMLLNDLGTYCEDMEAYAMTEAVLVFEIAEGTYDSISSLDLIVKNSDSNTTHRLR